MRSVIIVATCALAIFAAPIPEVDSIYKNNERFVERGFEQNTRRDGELEILRVNDGKRVVEANSEAKIEARAISNERHSHGAKPKVKNVNARGTIRNHSNKRSAEPEPVIRPGRGGKGGRKRAEEDFEARAFMNEGLSHNAKPKAKDVQARGAIKDESNIGDAELEREPVTPVSGTHTDSTKRNSSPGRVRPSQNGAVCHPGLNSNRCGTDNKRSSDDFAEVNDTESEAGDANLNKRSAAPEPINRGGNARSAEPEPFTRKHDSYRRSAEAEPFDHAGAGHRSGEPERFGRAGAGKRTTEPEPFDRAGAGRRSAEPEPFDRAGAGKRTAEPEPFDRAGAGRRSAEPEPAVTHGGADAGYRSQTCHPGLISSRC